ncbi:hypothetical protein QBC37DRAFT_485774 [Rhypophila decipiens]|uniref:Uncharacterized protein n=1 Tax=Rhypophila decipiens TaxID=261697 RepID=A0AAN6XZP8_9PEZI|nr:hypothetical protein QBC37DRAFT_485774 [Rhypophila decipiens]
MKFLSTLLLSAMASMVTAVPVEEEAAVAARVPAAEAEAAELETRQTASGCIYFAAPRCCVPTVCQCANGWIYQINQDAMNAGRHGCDPPWGFIATSNSRFPGYCC